MHKLKGIFPGSFDISQFRVEFDVELFDQMIETHGKEMTWERATWCPDFINNDKNQHNINCTICDGSGFVYSDPTPFKAVSQGINLQHVFRAEGRFDLGTQIVTVKSGFAVNIWDKLTYRETVTRYRQTLKRNSVDLIDRPRYDVLRVDRLATPETVFEQSRDFVVTDDGKIQWITATPPTDGDIYTIDYIHHPIYIVVDMPNEIRNALQTGSPLGTRENQVDFPTRHLAKRDFQIRPEGLDVRE